MSAKVDVLDPGQPDHAQPRRQIKRTQAITLVRKCIADWIVKYKRLRLRPLRAILETIQVSLPDVVRKAAVPQLLPPLEFYMPFTDLPFWLIHMYAEHA